MSEEKTDGQLAYEAMHASREQRDTESRHIPWEQLDESMARDFGALRREDMEAAAAAGAAPAHERTAELLTEVNELRKRNAELERLLAEAVDPTAQDYDNAAEIMRLRDALAEAAGHVEPVDQNSELAIARWQALAAGTDEGR